MMQGKLMRKHVMARYGITRKHLDTAIREQGLEFDGAWANTADVEAWALKHGHKRIDVGPLNELDGMQVSGGGLLPDELLEKVGSVNIPPEYVKAAMDSHDVAKSLVGIIKAQEGQLKMFKESGRLADLNESQAVIDGVIAALVDASRGLAKELAADTARRHKLKVADAGKVLGDASDYLLKVFEACQADLDKRVQAFQDQKAAELKQRKGK